MALDPARATYSWQLAFQGAWTTGVTFLGSARRIAAGNRDGKLLVWDLPEQPETKLEEKAFESPEAILTPPPSRCLVGHTNGITQLRATRDGKWLISSSLDHSIRIWSMDAEPGEPTDVILDEDTRARQARYKNGDEKTAILEAPGVSIPTQTAESVLEGHPDWVYSLAFSRDESKILSGDAGSRTIVWNFAARKEISRWEGHPWNWILAAALNADGTQALISEYRYKRDDFDIPAAALRVYDATAGTETLDLLKLQFPKLDPSKTTYSSAQLWRKFVANGLLAADFSPDGKLMAVAQGGETDSGKIHLFETETGKFLRSVADHKSGATDVKFTDDGKYVLSTGRDTTLQITAVEDGKEIGRLGKSRGGQFKDWLYSLSVSPDQSAIAAADIAGYVHVWQFAPEA